MLKDRHRYLDVCEDQYMPFVEFHIDKTPYYYLLDQWNQAIEALDSIVQPEYKVNDWVIYDNRIYQIIDIQRLHAKIIRKEEVAQLIQIKDIERHATQEEIKQHLLSLTDIEKGDWVRYKDFPVETEVEEVVLHGEEGSVSDLTDRYYRENGTHLVLRTTKGDILPLDQCEKVDDLSVETFDFNSKEKRKYHPEVGLNDLYFKNEKDKYIKYGCVSLDKETLISFRQVMRFCNKNQAELSVNEMGYLEGIHIKGEAIKDDISVSEINKLIDKLK